MTAPMTPEQRGEVRFYLPPGTRPADVATVARVAAGARALELTGDPHAARLGRDTVAVLARLLAAESGIATARRVLAEAVATARDLPDDGLGADDLLHLLTGAGLDLADDIEAAETIRLAEQTAGAPW